MKYCRSCRRLTIGDPTFCANCGRSYDKRLCPRLHESPISATICSQCGSRELSFSHKPASALSIGLSTIGFLLGMVLLAITLFYVVRYLKQFVAQGAPSPLLLATGLALGLAWLLFVSPGTRRPPRR
jgi:RNA polymerase subunit RPABC4/transcription elongation factor Spt4